MNSFKNYISLLVTYVNMLFIMRVTEKCFKIKNFSYIYFSICFGVGALIYYLFAYLPWKKIYKILLGLILIFIVSLIIYYNKQYVAKLIALNIQYILMLNDSIFNGEITFFYQYKFIITIVIPLSSLLILKIGNELFSDFIIAFNLAIMLFYWYYGYVEIVKGYTFYFVLINTCTYSIHSYIDNLKKGINTLRPIVYILLFSIVLSAVQSFLPKDIEGKYYSEDGIINKISRSNIDQEDSYNLSSSGYNPTDKKLGGPVQLDSREALKVASDKPYYLRGVAKDYYDGFSWKISEDSFKRVSNKNPIPVPNIVNESQKTYITIYPTKINTSTLFSPLNTMNIYKKSGGLYFNKDKVFLSSKVMKNEYRVEFYDSLYSSVDYINHTESGKYDSYLQLPPNIPKRVYDLVEEITKGSIDRKDKIKDIYNYLNTTFKYSLDVSEMPEGVEFLDHFLFTEKEGYCTYFATAATIMLRMINIPSRYVEGFNMSYDKDVNGLYIVSNKNAHAWSEILIDEDLDAWAILDATPSAFEEIERIEREEVERNKEDDSIESNKDNRQELEDGGGVIETNHKSVLRFNHKYSFVLLVLVFILRVLYIIFRKNKLIKCKKLIPLYIYALKRLKDINIRIQPHEGEMEFVNNIEDEILKLKMKEMVSQVFEEYYSPTKLDKKIENKKDYYYFIERYIKEKRGIWKYYIYRIFNK